MKKTETKGINLQFFATARRGRKIGNINVRLLALIAAALAVVAVSAIVICSLLSGSGLYTLERSAKYQVFDDDTLYFLLGGKKVDSKLDAENVLQWKTSMDGKVTGFAVDEDGEQILYLLSGNDILWIAEAPQQFVLADSGKALAYIVEEELCLYNVDKKSTERISAAAQRIDAISPDGKTVAYVDMDGYNCLYAEGRTYEMGAEVEKVLTVSDGGKYVYCLGLDDEGEDSLYLYSTKGQQGLIAWGIAKDAAFYTNKDHTQLIFQAEGKSGNKWYAVEMKELEDDRHTINSADLFEPLIAQNVQRYEENGVTVLGTDSLTGLVYTSRNTDDAAMKLVYVGTDWDTATLVSKVATAALGGEGEKIFYMKGEKLFAIEAKAGAQSREVADGVSSYHVAPDGKSVYYIDQKGSAYYCKGSSSKKIGEEVDSLTVTYDGYALFVSNGDLYRSKQGGKFKLVLSGFDGKIEAMADCTYYTIDEGTTQTLYVALRGAEFTELGTINVLQETDPIQPAE